MGFAPTIGTIVGRAADVAEAHGAEIGMALLRELPAEAVKSYQPYWALSAQFVQANAEIRRGSCCIQPFHWTVHGSFL